VNETFARQFDPKLGVVGTKVSLDFRKSPLTIVGVARTERYDPADPGMPQVFVLPGSNTVPNMTFVAKVRGRTEAYLPICRDAIRSVDPKVPVFNVQTFEQRLNDSLARPRFYTTVVLSLGAFALLLAIIGIYGVASFSVSQRTHEIGVRLAVGATPERLRAMLLRESLLPVAAGMALGLAAAPGLGSLVVHLIEGADAIGTGACALAAVMMLATAAIAVRMATRRILQLDPARALKTE
jgi:putative ABC transport system permease protein